MNYLDGVRLEEATEQGEEKKTTVLFVCLVVTELRKQKMYKVNFKCTHSAPQSRSYHASNKVNKSSSQMLTLALLQAKLTSFGRWHRETFIR